MDTPTAAVSASEVILETERLRLRELHEPDAPFILRLLNEPSWIRFIGNKTVHDLEGARAYIERTRKSYEAHGFGLWMVEKRGDGTPLGLCGLLKRDTLEHVDIGFALREGQQRCGYGLESSRAVMELARSRFGLERVVAIVSKDNEPSAALLERLGFRFERMIPWAATGEELKLFAA